MKKYTFVKVKQKNSKNAGIWYLLADSTDTINEHWKSYGASYMREGVHQLFNERRGHYTNYFATAVSVYAMSIACPIIEALVHIENEALRSRMAAFSKGITHYLDKGLKCLIDNATLEITKTIIKDRLVFPDEERLDIDDVKYTKWFGGFHWYAKVGNLDIVDEHNNQKWNTEEEAHKAAEWFINNYK